MHIFFFCTCRHYIAAKTEAVKNVPMSPHVMYVRNEVDCFTLEKAAERASTSAPPVALGFCRRISAMGSVTVGLQRNELTGGVAGATEQIADLYSIAFNVNENLAVSYGVKNTDFERKQH